jgi:hypothetical protein
MVKDVSKKYIAFTFMVQQSHRVHLYGNTDPEDEGTTILRNIGIYLPVNRN